MNLDIPRNDIDCWNRYTKHHWVYDLSRLLDSQNIKWSPYKTLSFDQPMMNLNLQHTSNTPQAVDSPGYIYITKPTGNTLHTEVYIIKGEVKLLRHIDTITHNELPNIVGEVELRINAFIALYFQRFTGVISVETIKNDIYAISLRPLDNAIHTIESDKLTKKIYKKCEEIVINLQEVLTV